LAPYGPRVEVTSTVQTRQIAEYIASRTSFNRSDIEGVLRELNEAIIFFTKQGQAVKLESVGTFTPTIDLGGVLDVGFRLDTSIDGALNAAGVFTGEVGNRENIGKSSADLKQIWNTAHPTDLIP
jgi:HU domain fused to wHTH, Ig, or Glycine-rich motif